MRKNYEINFTTKTITITKSFSEKAQDFGSEEFNSFRANSQTSLLLFLRQKQEKRTAKSPMTKW